MNISSPRTFSSILTKVSPSGKGLMVDLPISIPIEAQMALDNGSLDVPAKIFTIFVLSLKKGPPKGGGKSARDFNNERVIRKNFQRNSDQIELTQIKRHRGEELRGG